MTDENEKSALDQPMLEDKPVEVKLAPVIEPAPEESALHVPNKLRDPEVPAETPPAVDPALVEAIRKQVMDELKSEDERERLEKLEARAAAKKTHEAYVDQMKKSVDPWVDIQGWVETEQGVRIELDWNDAFVKHLKNEGITGADDDQVVQKWVTLLLADMSTQLEDEAPEKSDYS